jgi:hypothetical protein
MMRTEDLIAALARDPAPAGPAPETRLGRAAVAGFAVALAVCGTAFGWRESALALPVLLKLASFMALAAASLALLAGLAVPDGRVGRAARPAGLAALVLALLLAVLAEGPESAARLADLALYCGARILVLALVPLALLLAALRRAAPLRPVLAGATAGLAAGALATSAYALHCPIGDGGAALLAYAPALALLAAAGAVLGRRFLTW